MSKLMDTMKLLQETLPDKGYILCGVKVEGDDEFLQASDLVILMIHKDWHEFDLRTQWEQSWLDLPDSVQNMDVVLEIPTRDMFEERWAKEPHGFMIVFDKRVTQ